MFGRSGRLYVLFICGYSAVDLEFEIAVHYKKMLTSTEKQNWKSGSYNEMK